MPYATVNPATGLTEKTFDFHSPDEVEALVDRAVDAFADYRTTSYAERARHLVNAADLFEGEAPEMARIVTTEMGKTFAAARAEASKCAMAMRWFAEHAESLLADEPVTTAAVAFVRALPADRARAGCHAVELPAVAGHPVRRPRAHGGQRRLVKHASNVPQTALLLEDALPAGRGSTGRGSPTSSWRARTSRRSSKTPGSPP